MDLNTKFNKSLDLSQSSSASRHRKVQHINEILWIQNFQVPPLYRQLANYVTVENNISTPLLYKVLESSGLNQHALCAIWSVCNKTLPGQLTYNELFASIGLVAALQHNPSATIDLNSIASFPMVPNFNFDFSSEYRSAIISNAVTNPANTSVTDPSSDVTSSLSPSSSTVTNVSNIEKTTTHEPDEDEFGDFEEAVPSNISSISKPSPFVTYTSQQIPVTNSTFLPNNPTIQTFSSAEVTSNQQSSSELTNEEPSSDRDKYAAFKELSIETVQLDSLPPLESASNPSTDQPINGLDSLTSQNLELNTKPLSTSFSLSAISKFSKPDVPDENIDDDDDFGDFEEAKPEFQIPKSNSICIPTATQNSYPKLDLARVAKELNEARPVETSFDLLSGLDFSSVSSDNINHYATGSKLTSVMSLDLPQIPSDPTPDSTEFTENTSFDCDETLKATEHVEQISYEIITSETATKLGEFDDIEPDSNAEGCSSVDIDASDGVDHSKDLQVHVQSDATELSGSRDSEKTKNEVNELADNEKVEIEESDSTLENENVTIAPNATIIPDPSYEQNKNEQITENQKNEIKIIEQKIMSENSKIDNRPTKIDDARIVWTKLISNCLAIVRVAVDLFSSVEQCALKEVIDQKKGEEYLSGVCSAYLACYRFISTAHYFQISVSKEKSELDDLWKTIRTLLSDLTSLPKGKMRNLTRECKLCLQKSNSEYHVTCFNLCKKYNSETIIPDFTLVSK